MQDLITERDLPESSVTLLMPMPVPIPPSPDASQLLLSTFAERGITFRGNSLVRGLDAARNVALLADGDEVPYDLFLGVPMHRAPQVVVDAGLTADGWIPVDSQTLETTVPGVYAVGDVTSVGTPKAGVFAEGQAVVVARRIAEQLRGGSPDAAYDGRGLCYLEMGHNTVAKVDVTFVAGQPPTGSMIGPSQELVADKVAFGADRIRRWFGREWLSSP
jgi:sulfide:quinone oxidoreductase